KQIHSSEVRSFYKRLVSKFENIVASGAYILVSYRTELDGNMPYIKNFTWVDTNTIDESTGGDWNTSIMEVGQDIEFIRGKNSGFVTNIASISIGGGVAGVDRIELEDSVFSTTSTGFFMINN